MNQMTLRAHLILNSSPCCLRSSSLPLATEALHNTDYLQVSLEETFCFSLQPECHSRGKKRELPFSEW